MRMKKSTLNDMFCEMGGVMSYKLKGVDGLTTVRLLKLCSHYKHSLVFAALFHAAGTTINVSMEKADVLQTNPLFMLLFIDALIQIHCYNSRPVCVHVLWSTVPLV